MQDRVAAILLKSKNTTVMTSAQENAYTLARSVGWEFSHNEGDKIIIQLWRQDTAESRRLLSEMAINADGSQTPLE